MYNTYYFFLFIIILLIIIFVIINKITIKINNIQNAYSIMNIMLKKRYDLIPNLVKVVKAYTKHEKETLEKITKLREKVIEIENDEEKIKINEDIKNELNTLFIISENYPNLKSNINFIQLQTTLTNIEEEISAARRTYNAHVTDYNNFISIIPINIVSFLLRYKKYSLFEIKDEEKENKNWMNENE